METQAVSAIKTTFATLEEAADNLREALKIAEHFNRKLRGSHPQQMDKSDSPEPTLQNLAQEIFILSREVRAEVDSHHSVLGNSRQEAGNAQVIGGGSQFKGRAASGY